MLNDKVFVRAPDGQVMFAVPRNAVPSSVVLSVPSETSGVTERQAIPLAAG